MTNDLTPLVVHYLRSGNKSFADLEREHGVVARERNCKVSLSYHPMGAKFSDVLACQCRGLVLRMETWDVLAYPFDRFFDLGDPHAAKIDWSTSQVQEKVDGTMIIVYHDLGRWHVATRKDPEAGTVTSAGITYREMVELAVVDMGLGESLENFAKNKGRMVPDYTYVFELTAPENKVVCEYEFRRLWLLGVRSNLSMKERHPGLFLRTMILDKTNAADLRSMVESRDAKKHEGVVLVDANFNRVKLKSSEYNMLNHLLDQEKTYGWQWRNGAPWTSLVEAVLTGDSDTIEGHSNGLVGDQIMLVKRELRALCEEAEMVFGVIESIDDMKLFAKLANRYRWSSALFALKRETSGSAMEHAATMVPKNIVRLMKLPKL